MPQEKEILKEGFMVKKGHKRHNWKCRWFELHSTSLCYYKYKGDETLKGKINLKGCSIVSPDPEYTKKECVFRLIEILGKEFLLQCSNEEEKDSWLDEISGAIRKHDSLVKDIIKEELSEEMDSISSPTRLNMMKNRVTHLDLLAAMQDPEAGILPESHIEERECYKMSFKGERLVSWFLSWNFVKSREEGRALGAELLEEVHIHPVGVISSTSVKRKQARKTFSEESLYRFSLLTLNTMDVDFNMSDSEDSSEENTSDSVLGVITKQAFLVKKSQSRNHWKLRKFILYDEPSKLSYYSPVKGSRKCRGIKLLGSTIDRHVEVDTASCIGGHKVSREFCFAIRTRNGGIHILQAPSMEEKDDWIELLSRTIALYDTT